MAHPRRSNDAFAQSAEGARFLIVEARYYEEIGALMLEGALAALAAAGATHDVVNVPGALEIPVAMKIALDAAEAAGAPYAGALALGCVIRGETYHFEIVANESARALTEFGLERSLALGNGVLTVEDEAQALERADPRRGDKGGDAARAALALHGLKRRLAAPGDAAKKGAAR